MNTIENWHTLANLKGYEIYKLKHGYAGKLVDEKGNTIEFLGMKQDDIGFSFNYNQTKNIVEKEFNEMKGLIV